MPVVCFALWKELGAGHVHVPVPPACQERLWEGGKASSMQRHFKRAQPSFPPELICSPWLHHLCVFPLALWPRGWGRRKRKECLCAEFILGACLAISASPAWGPVSWELCAQKEPHITTAYPPGGELPQSHQWPKIYDGITLQAVSEWTAHCWLARCRETVGSLPLWVHLHI